MPSWKDSEESTEDDIDMSDSGCMDMEYLGGLNCGVVKWVDGPWPAILQNCLRKLWEMYHQQNCGRVVEKQGHEREVAKLKKLNDDLGNKYHKLVDDVSKLFDYADGNNVNEQYYSSQAEDFEKKKQEVEQHAKMEVQMEKLEMSKEQRCILQSQADIIQNTRKAMKRIKEDKDLLKEEKKKLECVIVDLLESGHGSKEKLEKIKAILEE